MFRLFLALNILFLNLLACKGGYESCKLKIIDSNTIQNQTLQIPVLKNKRLIYSKNTPNAKIIKYDPSLSLYLVEDRKKFKHPFKINNHLSLGVASVNEKKAIEGIVVTKQFGLNSFATFNEKVDAPALLLNSCCALEGIVTPEGIIEKKYIERFLKNISSDYGDIGIRVKDEKNGVLVKRVNPFFDNNPFKKDDLIVTFNGKKVKDSASLMQMILFSKVGTMQSVKVKRGSKYLSYKLKTKKRYGGGYLSDTFLEEQGIYFAQNLTILKISNKFKNYGLKVGDRLMQINGKKVSDIVDIEDDVGVFNREASLLFDREDFQFFIKINTHLTRENI